MPGRLLPAITQPEGTAAPGRWALLGPLGLCLVAGLVGSALLTGQRMPTEHFVRVAPVTQPTAAVAAIPPRLRDAVAQGPTALAGFLKDADAPTIQSQHSDSPHALGSFAMVALGSAVAFVWGYLLGRKRPQPLPMAMASVGDEENRSEWDKRVSVLDQGAPDTRLVSEADFGNLLVKFVQERFGEEQTKRIVDSFRRTERGEEFRQRFGPHPFMEQIASSYIAGLTTKPDWPAPAQTYPWAKVVQEGWPTIRAELEEAIRLGDEGLKAKGSVSWMGAQGGADSYGTEWKTLGLCDRGCWDDDNTRLFKNTCRILRKSRAPIMECFFAKMPAHTAIKPHSDYTNFVLTCHLGLKTPPKSHIACGDARHEWRDGEMFLLDTTFIHEAVNESNEDRYVLIMRVWHPDLTATEIKAITFLFDCVDDSDIILHPDGLAMYDMMKAHRIMEWNTILGPGDTEEESQEILRQIAEGQIPGEGIQDASKLSEMVKEKLKE